MSNPPVHLQLGEYPAIHGLPWWFRCLESGCNVGDLSLIPGFGRSPGGGHDNPLQYFCLENSVDRGAPGRLYSPWNSSGQNTGVGSLSLLQGIFQTQGSNSGLLHCRRILYQLSHQGSSESMGVFAKSPVHHSLATSDKQNDLLALQPVG